MKGKYLLATLLAAASILGFSCLVVAHRARLAGETEARMQNISTILSIEQPDDLTASSIRNLLARHDAEWCLLDSWGTPIEVGFEGLRDGQKIYSVRSYGSDKKKGTCCQGHLKLQLNEDAVKIGDEWVQHW